MKTNRNCSICGINFFGEGRMYYCDSCNKEYKKKYRAKNKEKIKSYQKKYVTIIETPEFKRCSFCENLLPADSFFKDRQKKTGLSSKCKKCSKKKKKSL